MNSNWTARLVLRGVAFAAVAGVILTVFAKPAYRGYRERRAATRAATFMANGDARNASLSARQALLLNSNNLPAAKIMAALAETSRSPQVLDWRRRVLELEPSTENRLQLAASALRAQPSPFPLTTAVLHELAPAASNTPSFHVLSAELALKMNQQALAASHFEIASRLEPTNRLHRLNLAVVRLGSADPATLQGAREDLTALKADPALAAVALRWLVGDSVQKAEFPSAERASRELLATPGATFEDRLELLSILVQAQSPALEREFGVVRELACTNATTVYSLSAWCISHGRAAAVLEWLTNLPAVVIREQPAPLALVEAYSALQDWEGLDRFLSQQTWGEMEFLRFAFQSRVASEQREPVAVEAQWRRAVLAAGDRLGPLTSLLNLAGRWNRPEAREEILWLIAERFPREKWAYRELDAIYSQTGDTRGLNRLHGALMRRDPGDLVAQNNFAVTSLLLGRNVERAHQIAREIYQTRPDDPIIATTYGFSLLRQNRATNAQAVLERLSAAQLEQPSVALYYGLVLRETGQSAKAADFLSRARRSASLLPEEKELLGETR